MSTIVGDTGQRERQLARPLPTVFGMTPIELHDRFWLSHGVQVVRVGDAGRRLPSATEFLLLDREGLAIFDASSVIRRFRRDQIDLVVVRLKDNRGRGYRELTVTDADGRFERFDRIYPLRDTRSTRFAVTDDPAIADAWRDAATNSEAWRRLRGVPKIRRVANSQRGYMYERDSNADLMQCVRDLVHLWSTPEQSLPNLRKAREEVWAESHTYIHPSARFFGPVWVGAGRHMDPWTTVIGPAVLWDDAKFLREKTAPARRWSDMVQMLGHTPTARSFSPLPREAPAPTQPLVQWHQQPRGSDRLGRVMKRIFDVGFSLLALGVTLPLYPIVMLMIWLEDGRPFFFGHLRESIGGREFFCWKFRSMRKDAEAVKAKLAEQNLADGPQFYMEEDPRLTRTGRILRKLQIDEWPQFFNVLAGDMSIVGPRPSPYAENQFCPAWREARLSVRPGITGLWQVRRSRAHGLDFQEWIRYDVQYVDNRSLALDLWIIFESAWMLIRYAGRALVNRLPVPRPRGEEKREISFPAAAEPFDSAPAGL